jgi:hypothetical protein
MARWNGPIMKQRWLKVKHRNGRMRPCLQGSGYDGPRWRVAILLFHDHAVDFTTS